MLDSLFQDPSKEIVLEHDGVIPLPFLDNEELRSLRLFYEEMHGDNAPPTLYDNGIHMTIWHHDTGYKLKIKNRLEEILQSACNRVFKNYRMLSPQFIVKLGFSGEFKIHQDWSIVDESRFRSLNLWIPLQDVDSQNGSMWIVKGSHKVPRKIRGGGYLFPDYSQMQDNLSAYATSYSLKAGECLLFYHNTIHGSPPNISSQARVVVQVSIVPLEAPIHIYFQRNEQAPLELHNPKDDFSYHYTRIREDSEEFGPTQHPAQILPTYKMKPVLWDEMLTYLQKNKEIN